MLKQYSLTLSDDVMLMGSLIGKYPTALSTQIKYIMPIVHKVKISRVITNKQYNNINRQNITDKMHYVKIVSVLDML